MLLFIVFRVGIIVNDISVSIHLMLLFIRDSTETLGANRGVSIHLMLLFIYRCLFNDIVRRGFNTSHVTLYQVKPSGLLRRPVSIHLMLLFILLYHARNHLSTCFNTSHVTLYRGTGKKDGGLFTTFQYISCYSLSVIYSSRSKAKNVVSIHLMLLFI